MAWMDGRTGMLISGPPETRAIFPGVHLRPEGGIIRNGINFYPLSEWRFSRGFILRFGRLKYRLRYSVGQRRFCGGWERQTA
jgi:hypothetical protein